MDTFSPGDLVWVTSGLGFPEPQAAVVEQVRLWVGGGAYVVYLESKGYSTEVMMGNVERRIKFREFL